MLEAVVGGIDGHRQWMLQVLTFDYTIGTSRDYMWFFNTRAEAEAYFERVAEIVKDRNVIVKIVKVRAYDFLEPGTELIEEEN